MELLTKLQNTEFQTVSPWPDYKYIDNQGNIPFRYYNYDSQTNIFAIVSFRVFVSPAKQKRDIRIAFPAVV